MEYTLILKVHRRVSGLTALLCGYLTASQTAVVLIISTSGHMLVASAASLHPPGGGAHSGGAPPHHHHHSDHLHPPPTTTAPHPAVIPVRDVNRWKCFPAALSQFFAPAPRAVISADRQEQCRAAMTPLIR